MIGNNPIVLKSFLRGLVTMKKLIKIQLINLTESSVEGVDFCFSQIKSPEHAHNMLLDCYEAVNSLKEQLELEFSKEDFAEYEAVITKLQEGLESFNESLLNSKSCDEIFNYIKGLLEGLKTKMEKEPVKIEVVFLPYKASMWDSLESV